MSEADKLNTASELLKVHYGYTSFRPGQKQAIEAALAGCSVAVIMPTGGGKSLCYQLPALVLPGVTIVVSPLIALMKDQVDGLTKVGIPATFINSSISQAETFNRLEAVKSGQCKLLYIAPERFYNAEFTTALKNIEVSLFAIDEAHCISQWGHDFRPSYLKLKWAIEAVGRPPVMALTATATPEVRADIIKQLGLENPKLVVTGFARPNLQFGVIHANETKKPQLVIDALTSVPDGTGIVYVSTRARADALLQFLLEHDIEAVGYHAGMEAEDRKWVQNNFMSGQAKVIVATNAFGLGIDKPDIRFVIHYDMPGTVEAYYQEAGRAGRDGRPSFCLLLYNSRDRALHEFFIKGDNPPPNVIRELYEILLNYESDVVLITYAELAAMLSDKLPEMAIGTGIKILEREGYIARSTERSGNAFLKFLKGAEYILDTISPQAKKLRETVIKLKDRFGNEVADGWQFNPDEAAEILEIKRESLMRAIRKLNDEGLLEYRPPFKGTEIRVLKRVNPSEIEFDEAAMRAKLKAAHDKLDKIEEYVYDFGCRQKFMLDYFGDHDSGACGKCDICLTGKALGAKQQPPGLPVKKPAGYFHRGMKRPADENYAADPPERKSGLSTKLTQLETLELYNQGKDVKEIARLRDLEPPTVMDHICYLVEKGIIKNIDKLVDKKTVVRVMETIEKIGGDKLKPIYEQLEGAVDYDKIKLIISKRIADRHKLQIRNR